MTVPKELFGKDHWSTLAYIGHVVTKLEGEPDREKMRTHKKNRHLMGRMNAMMMLAGGPWSKTHLADGTELDEHDDYDCVDDMIEAGLIRHLGTGMHPIYDLTDEGWSMYRRVITFRRAGVPGRSFADFRPYDPAWVAATP